MIFHSKNRRNPSKKRLRTKFLGLFERLEERLPLTGPYVNASLSEQNLLALMEGSRGMSGLGERVDQSGYHSQPLAPFKNRDGSALTPGLLGPFGKTIEQGIENPIGDYYDNTPVDQRSTDSLIAHLGSDPAFLSIEGGLVDGTIDELVFDIHIRREYVLNLVDIEFSSELLPNSFFTENGVEVNLSAIVEYQSIIGITLDPTLSFEQAFFVRDASLFTSIRVDQVLHPFTVNLGIVEASVPDVVLSGNLDISVSQPASTPSLRLTEINSFEVDELFSSTLDNNNFDATFNLDVGIGRWRLAGSTYLQTVGDWLGFDPAITFSPNFDEIFLFGNITSGEIAAGMENFQAWLTGLSNSSAYNIPIPFTSSATTGSTLNIGQGMSRFTDSLRDDEGNPSFDNAQEFPYTGTGIDYNPTTNKLFFTIIQPLPRQESQSRATRVSVDDTLGLTSETEAVITGSGTLNLVLSIDLSDDSTFDPPENEEVSFLDRVSVEHLSIQTDYSTEANLLTGNAAYGGLGLAFANAVLSGEFSTEIVIGSALRQFSLRVLNDSLNDVRSILTRDIKWLGDMVLRVPSLSVMGNLFGLASDAFVQVSVNDIASGVIETTTNASDLLNFEGISFEGLTDTLSEALLGTQAWDSEGDSAVATLGVSLDDFGPLKQDRIVDALGDAVEQADNAVGLARRIVQDVPATIENLRVTSGATAVQFVSDLTYNATSGVLSWLVDASAEETSSVSVGLGFESLFGYTNDSNVSGTDDLVGEKASLPATSFSRLLLGMEFDPPAGRGGRSLPGSYLTNQSRLERTLYVNATPAGGSPVIIEGASGAMGMRLNNGSVVIAQNATTPDPAQPAQFYSTFPLRTPRIRISDLESFVPQRTTIGQLRGNFRVVPDHTGTPEANRLIFRVNNFNNPANSTVLQSSPNFPSLRQGLDLQVNMNALVDSLDAWFKKVGERVAKEVFGKAYPLIGDKLDQFTNFIEELRQTISTALDTLSSFTVADVENKIETALQSLFGNPNGDYLHVEIPLPTQIKLTLDIDDAPIQSRKRVETNLGLPALGVEWLSDIEVIGSYDFEVTFVMDVFEGFYVETNTERIGLFFDANVFGGATGRLGFFEVIATAQAPAVGQSAFHAEYVIDLTEPSGDGKLFLREIGNGPLVDVESSGLSGEAHMEFEIAAVVNDWLPSLETGLRIDWEFDGIGFSGSNPPTVTYYGIQLDLGRLLEEVFLPLFESLKRVYEPMAPAIEFLTTPLPVIDELTDPPLSLNSVAQALAKTLPPTSDVRKAIESLAQFIDTLATINRIVSAIQIDKNSGLKLQLGDLSFGGSSSPQFDARQSILDPSVVNEAKGRNDLKSQFDSGAKKVAGEFTTTPGSLSLPILENPLSAIGWILGMGEANIITWDLPNVEVSFPMGFTFPVFPGIVASIFGGLEIGIDLKVGYDTAGLSAYAKSGDVADLFEGFYVSDRANADGTGADVNEIYVRGELFAGAGIGTEIAGVGVSLIMGGGVFAEGGIDLIDHDKDGKMRGSDLSSGDGCFALRGEVGVALEAKAKVGILSYELPLTEATIGKGRVKIPCPFYVPPPSAILAGLDPVSGTLTLFMGPEAHRRDKNPNAEIEEFQVEESQGELIVSAFGTEQRFNRQLVRSIVADGGSKEDRIELVNVTVPSTLSGGDGDDVIFGGLSIDAINGGNGADEMHGNAGADTLSGQLGDDLLFGDEGEDTLLGDEGDDTLYGGPDNDRIETGEGSNLAYGDGGDDTLIGGSRRDRLHGGDDNDTIEGGMGRDILFGDKGIDTLRGQAGDDTLDGGDDDDFLYGDAGDDRLWGRDGIDWIYGDIGLDYINGGEQGDHLFGESDNDEIDGDLGDDEIRGGTGQDTLRGQNGIDTIYGGNDRDLIYGGNGPDILYGDRGNDEIYGEEGSDTMSGGAGDDLLLGGIGVDTIYGFQENRWSVHLEPNETDLDTVRGGMGADRIAGGPGNDLLYGEEDADEILGNEGADTIEGNDGPDTIYGFNHYTTWSLVTEGTDLANVLYGNKDDDEIHGGPEADTIRGHAGNDRLFGEAGDDSIYGDDGNDFILGGDNIDTIDGGLGNDVISGNDDSDLLYGNNGLDTITGDDGDDFISGNGQADFLYGDSDNDEIYGGSGNDTIRGGDDNDTIYGQTGDDLIIGHQGVDNLSGDEGDDLLYGGTQSDTLSGGLGNDRLYGELGEDTLFGNDGDDILEGGGSNDTLSGDDGNDVLYGDDGDDTLNGGSGDDSLFAGDGVSNLLNGDEGNDVLIGSDAGDEDPKFGDTIYFGDRLNGGDGDDAIDGLGGADIIDGGSGINSIRGGHHTDSVINGTDQTLVSVPFAMPSGPDRRGPWSELSRSASIGGLTNMGGFEEAMYVDVDGVYVAWVDWRNGNSEIYVAFHPNGVGEWTALDGFNGNSSASGGGISNDTHQSRRPTLFKTEDSDSLVVAWTSIASDGSSNIEVARQDTNWNRMPNPAQTGMADHASWIQFADLSGLLFWIDGSSGKDQLSVTQYIHAVGCFEGFGRASAVGGLPIGEEVKDYDVAAVEFQAVVAMSWGNANDQDIVIVHNLNALAGNAQLCPAVPNASVTEYTYSNWVELHRETDGDTQNPAIGIQYIRQEGTVKGEIKLEFDVAVAWEFSAQRENQVDGIVIHVPIRGVPTTQPMLPEYRSDNGPRSNASTISDTRGYAAKPDIAMTYAQTTLGWMDDGIFGGDNRSSIYVLSRYRDTTPGDYVLREQEPHDASGQGISETGGSLQELSLMAAEDGFLGSYPFALWTEAATPLPVNAVGQLHFTQNVYMRVTLPGLQAIDDLARARKFGRFDGNVLTNDLNIKGEFDGYVSKFDSYELSPFDQFGVDFTSPLGAKVTVNTDGQVTYNPRGVLAFRSLKRGESLTESFVYRVNNGIHEAEGVVEFVVFGSNAWRNDRNHLDVDDDNFVGPLDVLNLINDINLKGARELDDIGPSLKQFLDVDDDGSISALDVLNVINWLNSRGSGEGEGVGEGESIDSHETNMQVIYAGMGYMQDVWPESFELTKLQRRTKSPSLREGRPSGQRG